MWMYITIKANNEKQYQQIANKLKDNEDYLRRLYIGEKDNEVNFSCRLCQEAWDFVEEFAAFGDDMIMEFCCEINMCNQLAIHKSKDGAWEQVELIETEEPKLPQGFISAILYSKNKESNFKEQLCRKAIDNDEVINENGGYSACIHPQKDLFLLVNDVDFDIWETLNLFKINGCEIRVYDGKIENSDLNNNIALPLLGRYECQNGVWEQIEKN